MWTVTCLVGLVYSHHRCNLGFIIKLNYSHLSDSLQLLLRVDLTGEHFEEGDDLVSQCKCKIKVLKTPSPKVIRPHFFFPEASAAQCRIS